MKYQNRQVIITGGSSGIGKATALLLAERGANLALIARDRQKLEVAKTEIEAVKIVPTQKVIILAADVAQFTEIETAIQSAISELGGLDLVDYFGRYSSSRLLFRVIESSFRANYGS